MSPIATTSDAAPKATPKRARSETVFGSPRRLPKRNRFARNAGTFIGASDLPLLLLHLPRAVFLGHVDDADRDFAFLLALDGEVRRLALLGDLQGLYVRCGHHLDQADHFLRIRAVEVLRLLLRHEVAHRPEVLLLDGLEEVRVHLRLRALLGGRCLRRCRRYGLGLAGDLGAERDVERVGVSEELVRFRALVAAVNRLAVEHLLREDVLGREAARARALEAVVPERGRDRLFPPLARAEEGDGRGG